MVPALSKKISGNNKNNVGRCMETGKSQRNRRVMEYEEEGFVTGLQAATHVGTIWGRGRTSRGRKGHREMWERISRNIVA